MDNDKDAKDQSGDKSGDKDPKDKTVKREDFDRLAAENLKFKKDFEANNTELAALKAQFAEQERKAKEKGGEWKTLYENEKTSKTELETKYSKLKDGMVINEKHKAASAALVKAGIMPTALNLLDHQDFSELVAEHTTQGRTLISGEDLFVEKFKKAYPYAFGQGKPPVQNQGSGNFGSGDDGKFTIDDLHAVESKHGRHGQQYRDAFAKYHKSKFGTKQ